MDRIINMVINQLLRRFISKGIDKGMGALSRKKPQNPPRED
ncbi:MAG: hypothetical protein ABJ327_02190 [Litoreibacter sp.]